MTDEYIAIKDGKIYDICSNLKNKRDDTIRDEDYKLLLLDGSWVIGDSWDSENDTSLTDSPLRNPPVVKSMLELKVEDLEARITELEKG